MIDQTNNKPWEEILQLIHSTVAPFEDGEIIQNVLAGHANSVENNTNIDTTDGRRFIITVGIHKTKREIIKK